MRTWQRTRVVESCGSCGKPQAIGLPIQVIVLPGVNPAVRRIRCTGCADGPLDDEQLEAFDVAEEGRTAARTVLPNAPEFVGVTRNLFDAKVAAAGDDK